MKTFLERAGIVVKNDKPNYHIKLNIILFIIEASYFGLSFKNLLANTAVNITVIILNILSFARLFLINYKKEAEKIDTSEQGQGQIRYSLYFFIALIEAIIGVLLPITILSLGGGIDRWNVLLMIMLIITFLNNILNIIISLYRGK